MLMTLGSCTQDADTQAEGFQYSETIFWMAFIVIVLAAIAIPIVMWANKVDKKKNKKESKKEKEAAEEMKHAGDPHAKDKGADGSGHAKHHDEDDGDHADLPKKPYSEVLFSGLKGLIEILIMIAVVAWLGRFVFIKYIEPAWNKHTAMPTKRGQEATPVKYKIDLEPNVESAPVTITSNYFTFGATSHGQVFAHVTKPDGWDTAYEVVGTVPDLKLPYGSTYSWKATQKAQIVYQQ